MTKDELITEVLSRHNKNKTYHCKVVSEALGMKESSIKNKISKMPDGEFKTKNFIGRAYNDEVNHYRTYYDITKAGVLFLLTTQQDYLPKIAIVEKLISYL